MDDNVIFKNYTQEEGFELLFIYEPFIASPFMDHPQYNTNNDIILNSEAHTVINFDAMCNCFSKDAIISNNIFPYVNKFDKENWWMSQYIMANLCNKYYNNQIIIFRQLRVINELHSPYPKLDCWANVKNYISNELINDNKYICIDENDNLFNKNISIYKRIDVKYLIRKNYLNLYNNNVIKNIDIIILDLWLKNF